MPFPAAVFTTLIKVMLPLIKNRITLTAATIERVESRLVLPDELLTATEKAAETVVGESLPAEL